MRTLVTLALVVGPALLHAQAKPTVEQFMGASSPLQITSARKADRVAWMSYERGMRNVYTAAAPDFKAVRLTPFLQDDGIDLTNVEISDDGRMIVFVRGSAPNRNGWIANPSHDPDGGERAIWAVRSAGGAPWKVAIGGDPELSPDGSMVAYVKDGQIYGARLTPTGPKDSIDRALKPLVKAWGSQRAPRWSPDSKRLAFVSVRQNHSFIGVLDVTKRSVTYMAPSVDYDDAPTWSPDGKEIAFTRRPGQAFGQQGQVGIGSIGNPSGPAAGGAATRGPCASVPLGSQGFGNQAPVAAPSPNEPPGLCRATFAGGHTLSVMVATVATGAARELWHNAPSDKVFTTIARMMWGDGHLVFPLSPAADEWDRYYALRTNGNGMPAPITLTTTDGMIEDVTSAALSKDGRTLYYCTNAGDIERRHIWAVPVGGGTPQQITTGRDVETAPQPLASGKQLAVLHFSARTPAAVALAPVSGGAARPIFPSFANFPADAHVEPEVVIVKSPDGMEIHNQLFVPKDIKPGERRPALIFVHGGPVRQMLPAYHYMHFYSWSYGYNQWLASQGYVVLSVNYRSGVGYGKSFRNAPKSGGNGNAEYQDVLAAGKWLQARPDVDPARVGIWGLSYGGVLTAQALARNSDVFVAGADLAGVHLWGNSLDTAAVSYKSSAIAAIDGWKSPVFLVHGDDDRNVDFAQTVGLVQLLRARNVYHELMVIPDDLHESMFHGIWIDTWNRIGGFLKRFVWDKQVAATSP